MKQLLYALTIFATLAIAGAAGADGSPATRLVESARQAGMEASPLVFERDAGADPDAATGARLTGRALVLATAIASTAAVAVAWLLRGRNECASITPYPESAVTLSGNWTWTPPEVRWETRPDGTPYPITAPPPPTPRPVCVAR